MEESHSDKRTAILSASLTLFTERGFHGTPTSMIAREAGIATGTLFHYFKTKEELITALYLSVKKGGRGGPEGRRRRGERLGGET